MAGGNQQQHSAGTSRTTSEIQAPYDPEVLPSGPLTVFDLYAAANPGGKDRSSFANDLASRAREVIIDCGNKVKKSDPKTPILHVPKDRLDDLFMGESQRGLCCFEEHHTDPGRQKKGGKQKAFNKASIIRTRYYRCTHGPEDHSKSELPASGLIKPGGQRRSGNLAGESMKVGCQYRFSITERHLAHPKFAEVLLLQPSHVNLKGEPCHGHGCDSHNPKLRQHTRISDDCEEYVKKLLKVDPYMTTHHIRQGEHQNTSRCVCLCAAITVSSMPSSYHEELCLHAS